MLGLTAGTPCGTQPHLIWQHADCPPLPTLRVTGTVLSSPGATPASSMAAGVTRRRPAAAIGAVHRTQMYDIVIKGAYWLLTPVSMAYRVCIDCQGACFLTQGSSSFGGFPALLLFRLWGPSRASA